MYSSRRGIEHFVVLERVERNEPDYERICKLLDISMKPRDTLAHRSKWLVYSIASAY